MRAVPNVPLLWLALLLVVPASSAIVYAEDAGKIPGLLLLVAFVLKRWGEPMLAVIEKRLALFTVLFVVLLVGAFFAVKLIGH